MAYDGLFDAFTDQAMGSLTEACNAAGDDLTREEQDAFAARSHQRAAEAWKNGVFDDEVVPVEIPQRRGDPIVVSDGRGRPRRHDRRVAGRAAARRSPRTARSPPARPRRSPTVPARSS